MPRADWRETIKKRFSQALLDEPMSRHTTFRIGGPADCYVEIERSEDLRDLFRIAAENDTPVFMLGFGSNLLVQDGGLRGLVLRLKGEFEAVSFPGKSRVRAGAGVRLPQLVTECAENGLAGSESLVGVPGTVGGALVMNAGTRDGEIGDLVLSVDIFDTKTGVVTSLSSEQVRFEYRRSNLSDSIVLGCLLQLNAGEKVDIMERVRNYQQARQQTQPIHTFNVGSVFKNPPGRFVAELIEKAGLKGLAQGGARISPQHANFIENHAEATAKDVLALVGRIRDTVLAQEGVRLEIEMKVVGEA